MAASEALIERLREQAWTITHMEAADHIEKLEADKARLDDALRQAVIDAAEWARKAGEAQGKLEISEAAGILDGWIRDCEQLRADKALLREALIRIDGHYTDNPCATAEEADRLTIEEMAQMARAALQETSHD